MLFHEFLEYHQVRLFETAGPGQEHAIAIGCAIPRIRRQHLADSSPADPAVDLRGADPFRVRELGFDLLDRVSPCGLPAGQIVLCERFDNLADERQAFLTDPDQESGLGLFPFVEPGNGIVGILLANSSYANKIGTNADGLGDAAERNIVSDNGVVGIILLGAGSGNSVAGNYVGLDVSGDAIVGTQAFGIDSNATADALIGTNGDGVNDAAERNVVAGNGSADVTIVFSSNAVIAGNYIGVDSTGTTAFGNGGGVGISVNSSSAIRIGTNGDGIGDAMERNVIAGNQNTDITIGQSTNCFVAGNYIGINAAGTQLVGASQNGVYVWSSSGIRIGTDGNSVNNSGERNIISGTGFGIEFDQATHDSQIAGNYVGLDATGTLGLGNISFGILINGPGTSNNIVGTNGASLDNAAERNIVSNNGVAGIYVNNAGSGNVVSGNYIGTDVTGTTAVGSQVVGVIGNATTGLLIGTTKTGPASVVERNLISGGNQYGVDLFGFQQGVSNSTIVAGNYIGTDVSGTQALGNSIAGVLLFGGITEITISSNVISANGQYGILSANFLDTFYRDQIAITGNKIGTDVTGTLNLANGSGGILLEDNSRNFQIGGPAPGQANVIAYNQGDGVTVAGNNSQGNSIRQNSIFANTGLGIDLGDDGVTSNDANDVDASANGLQNFPVLTLVQAGSSTHIVGTIQGAANTTLTIDFYSNPAADPSGYGQGRQYLGSAVVTTDSFGNGALDVTFAVSTSVGSAISATATDAGGNTSEFSPDQTAVADAPLTDTTPATTYHSVEGHTTGTFVLATFTDADPDAMPSNFTANVNWGGTLGGTPTAGVQLLFRTATASYWQVTGSATYAGTGNNIVAVTVNSAGGSSVATNKTTVSVADAPLTDTTVASTIHASVGASTGTVVLATFTDGNPFAAVTDFSTTVNFGGPVSGTPSASIQLVSRTGTVSTWQVVGNVTYTATGNYAVTVTVNDVGGSSFTTSKTSVTVASNAAILLLDATGSGALTDSGNGQIIVGGYGHIVVASTSATAVIVSGNGTVTASELDLESSTGTQTSGHGTINGQVDHGVVPSEAIDPLLSHPVPAMPATQFAAANISGNTTVTLQPGRYNGGIHISGNARVTLAPGIYFLNGGGFTVTGDAVVTGNGVFIYNNATNSTSDAITFSGNARVTLTAQTSGDYQGIVFFQSRTSTAQITLSGNARVILMGTIYAAKAKVNISGNGLLQLLGPDSELIAYDLIVTGNGIVKVDA